MPATINYNSDKTRVEISLTGHISGPEIVALNRKIASCVTCISQIWNYLDAESLNVSLQEMHVIARQDHSLPENSALKRVAIVGAEDVLHGLDKLYETFSKEWVGRPLNFESRTFASLEAAHGWMDRE